VARQALFRECGLDFTQLHGREEIRLPVIRSMVKYIRPLRLDDEFVCTAVLKEASVKIVLDFEIRLVSDGKVCTRAEVNKQRSGYRRWRWF